MIYCCWCGKKHKKEDCWLGSKEAHKKLWKPIIKRLKKLKIIKT